jgi:hypothetical protein
VTQTRPILTPQLAINYRLKLSNDDYKGQDEAAALEDFKERVRNYERVYETVDDVAECTPLALSLWSETPFRPRSTSQSESSVGHREATEKEETREGTKAAPMNAPITGRSRVSSRGSLSSGIPSRAEPRDPFDQQRLPGCIKLIDAGRKLVATHCDSCAHSPRQPS